MPSASRFVRVSPQLSATDWIIERLDAAAAAASAAFAFCCLGCLSIALLLVVCILLSRKHRKVRGLVRPAPLPFPPSASADSSRGVRCLRSVLNTSCFSAPLKLVKRSSCRRCRANSNNAIFSRDRDGGALPRKCRSLCKSSSLAFRVAVSRACRLPKGNKLVDSKKPSWGLEAFH